MGEIGYRRASGAEIDATGIAVAGLDRDRLSFPLFFCGLVKAHASAPAVLIDELDAGGF